MKKIKKMLVMGVLVGTVALSFVTSPALPASHKSNTISAEKNDPATPAHKVSVKKSGGGTGGGGIYDEDTDTDDNNTISALLKSCDMLNTQGYILEDSRFIKDYTEEDDDYNYYSYAKKHSIVDIVGENQNYYKVAFGDFYAYIEKDKVSLDVEELIKLKLQEEDQALIDAEENKAIEAKLKKQKETKNIKQNAPVKWNGSKLNKRDGVNHGPSGKETYYNLPMNGVIKIMRRMGNNDKYWVREDGCKMLGNYIMVAANLNVRPRGSLVETSLGTGIVCDTGSFAKRNIYQLDIAVNWR